MNNTVNSAEIINKLYTAYGSGSGVLFGITDKAAVEAIVNFALDYSAPLPEEPLKEVAVSPVEGFLYNLAIKESEIQFPYEHFRGKDRNGPEGEHTGQALRGACVGGFEAGYKLAKAEHPTEEAGKYDSHYDKHGTVIYLDVPVPTPLWEDDKTEDVKEVSGVVWGEDFIKRIDRLARYQYDNVGFNENDGGLSLYLSGARFAATQLITADLSEGKEFDSPVSLFLRGENDLLKLENERLKNELECTKHNNRTGQVLAMEYGYKQCEKGNNLDLAYINFNSLLNSKR